MDDLVGIVGLGNMGGGIAENLVRHGLQVVGYDKDTKKNTRLSNISKYIVSNDLTECAAKSDVLILSLPNGKVALNVMEHLPVSVKDKAPPIIDTTTCSTKDSEILSRMSSSKGFSYVPCKLGGGPLQAKQGKLLLMVYAQPHIYEKIDRVLNIMGKPIKFNSQSEAVTMKLIVNFVAESSIATLAESLLILERVFSDLNIAENLLKKIGLLNDLQLLWLEKMRKRDFEESFPVNLASGVLKDLILSADSFGIKHLPVCETIIEEMQQMSSIDLGKKETPELIEMLNIKNTKTGNMVS